MQIHIKISIVGFDNIWKPVKKIPHGDDDVVLCD